MAGIEVEIHYTRFCRKGIRFDVPTADVTVFTAEEQPVKSRVVDLTSFKLSDRCFVRQDVSSGYISYATPSRDGFTAREAETQVTVSIGPEAVGKFLKNEGEDLTVFVSAHTV